MKLFSALLVTLASTAALAMPTVNDAANYDITLTSAGQTLKGTQDRVVTALDSATQLYTVKETVTLNGQTQVKEVKVTKDKLFSDAAAEQLMSSCSAQGGTVQQVTVAAGTLPACAIPYNDSGATGTIYVGKVPFAVIKMEISANGQTMTLALRSYNIAQ